MRFLDGISETRKAELLGQIRAVWTHDSTAIEGNALTLGDTMFVLGYGLTVKGKPLKDQLDINEQCFDIYKPIGAYKREDYIRSIWEYESGVADPSAFKSLARESWQATLDLVREARLLT